MRKETKELIGGMIGSIMVCFVLFGIFCAIGNDLKRSNAKIRLETETLAQVICAEAVGEGKMGMYLVANTIANRAKLYKKSPYEIVTEPAQYSGIDNQNKDELYRQGKMFADQLARNIMYYPDLSDGALYFRRPEEERKAWHKIETVRWLNHIFYK